jgi:hypothetical protein
MAKNTAKKPAAEDRSFTVSDADRKGLYAAARYIGSKIEQKAGLQILFNVYLQDPSVAETDPRLGLDESFYVHWEPGLADGPTSARFAVVDFNSDTGRIVPPAEWDPTQQKFTFDGKVLDRDGLDTLQFHQVNVWAVLQRALDFFEGGQGLGRRISWGFEGNRLIVVPHAGFGQNAFYDRRSKSLQFYYFGPDDQRVYTCLSTDIIHHEFGHAVLDGVRPYFIESTSPETAAFHEFLGDLTAILIILRNNSFRQRLADSTAGNLSDADQLAFIAEEFGRTVRNKPYLRSAKNQKTMDDVRGERGPHLISQVLTGAMFDILIALAKFFVEERGRTARQAFWDTIQRMQRTAIQPLDLLPPVDVSFRDYALAVLRADELANPTDPFSHFDRMLAIFRKRKILSQEDEDALHEPRYLTERLRLSVFHDVDSIAGSREAAYRFLDDNREDLHIPWNQDVLVADLYDANKLGRQAMRLPRQTILIYLWRETIPLQSARFGALNGQTTTLLCGGTLVFDDKGTVLHWAKKPGTQATMPPRRKPRRGAWLDEETAMIAEGERRREALLDDLARLVKSGRLGFAPEGERGLLGSRMPPLTVRRADGKAHVELTPHLSLAEDDDMGERQWEMSF